ncbi:HAMP domain-containing sensor histidine kinase [Oceanihabitans sediminis]|uniref:histidine kinase n=1 Tax=Oceanihabitans sediminis TaxID=1812012 RepID=A0A368P824_9FLAO|nr:HAMP domain-containing sensor histidine kinase [Oceanihabitans sediminis]MDX1278078.1 ATP-binding protein [Oceanihabitans sediminis]MDX1772907.1 ATP-binding protein [Oceanihabitans sediminis]RBP34592.1 phospho-acceptor domain-containing protein [Oceanihabitans sediminis]RCU58254.1 sensor histidine kinase [Oceanihabitans sediminis]
MKLKKLSLRLRIFLAMIFLVLVASILITMVSVFQYKEETEDYHKQRLERKETAVKRHISFVIQETSFEVKTEKIPFIFREEIYKIATTHDLPLIIYDLDGQLLKSSKASLTQDSIQSCLNSHVLNALVNTVEHRFVEKRKVGEETYQSSYTYITDQKSKPIAILNLPLLENDDFLAKELNEFLERIALAYLFMLLTAIILAYILSKYITRSLKTISDKINETRLERRNQKIEIESATVEIATLVESYNSMIDELEESAVKLATSEREQAWREMAKQVAHEIKNPLTPMRLSVQSFQRKFDPTDENIHQKVDEYSKTLIQQIDIMSSIASAFSNFAKMPAQKNEMLNVVEIVNLSLDIFNEDYIDFSSNKEEIIAKFDRTQLIRVVTNLIKNGIQSIPKDRTPKIIVRVLEDGEDVKITVSDNGIGISEENQLKIFEPKFTTKSSGMGLGLAMVKNIMETYNGSITFTTEMGSGTIFTVTFPKE